MNVGSIINKRITVSLLLALLASSTGTLRAEQDLVLDESAIPPGRKLTAIEAFPDRIELTNRYGYRQVVLTGTLDSGERLDVPVAPSTAMIFLDSCVISGSFGLVSNGQSHLSAASRFATETEGLRAGAIDRGAYFGHERRVAIGLTHEVSFRPEDERVDPMLEGEAGDLVDPLVTRTTEKRLGAAVGDDPVDVG